MNLLYPAAAVAAALLIAPVPSQIRIGPVGGTGGSPFEFSAPNGARITAISGRHARLIDRIEIHWVMVNGQPGSGSSGGSGGGPFSFGIRSDDHFTQVEVQWGGLIDRITLSADKGGSRCYGGYNCTHRPPNRATLGAGAGYEICGFFGRSGRVIDKLGILLRPVVPNGIAARAVSSTEIEFTWIDRSPGESGFRIERSTDGRNYFHHATAARSAQSFRDRGLQPDRTYWYRISSMFNNNASWGAYTDPVSAKTAHRLPNPPSDMRAVAKGATEIALSWADRSDNEIGFKIERSESGGGFQQIAIVGVNRNMYNNTGLNATTNYCYRVRAFNAAGNSGYSNQACAQTSDPECTFRRLNSWCTSMTLTGVDRPANRLHNFTFTLVGAPAGEFVFWLFGSETQVPLPFSPCQLRVSPWVAIPRKATGFIDTFNVPGVGRTISSAAVQVLRAVTSQPLVLDASNGLALSCR